VSAPPADRRCRGPPSIGRPRGPPWHTPHADLAPRASLSPHATGPPPPPPCGRAAAAAAALRRSSESLHKHFTFLASAADFLPWESGTPSGPFGPFPRPQGLRAIRVSAEHRSPLTAPAAPPAPSRCCPAWRTAPTPGVARRSLGAIAVARGGGPGWRRCGGGPGAGSAGPGSGGLSAAVAVGLGGCG
jgi:hypothetical protein